MRSRNPITSMLPILLALTGAQVAARQLPMPGLSSLPDCAALCFRSSVREVPCLPMDKDCVCDSSRLHQAVSECVTGHCSVEQAFRSSNILALACAESSRDKSPRNLSASAAWSITASVLVAQRLAYKFLAKIELGLDDFLVVLALFISVPSIIFSAHISGPDTMGHDAWGLLYDSISKFCRYFFITEVIYYVSIAVVKLSILFFYLRVFPKRGVRHLLWGTVLFTCLFGGTYMLVALFQCRPVHHYWSKWEGGSSGQCLNVTAIARSNAIINIALDVWMLAIPIWQLKDLALDWKKKAGVAVMFGVGTFVTVVSILRLQAYNLKADAPNPTWDLFDIGIWSVVEIDVGIIGACMPSLRAMLNDLLLRMQALIRKLRASPIGGTGASTRKTPIGASDNMAADVKQQCQYPPGLSINCGNSSKAQLEESEGEEVQLVYLSSSETSLRRTPSQVSQIIFIVAPCQVYSP